MPIKDYDFYYQIRRLYYVQQIWLYGSQARGTATNQSDFDLAITCPIATEDQWQNIKKIVEEADTLTKIDLVRFDQLPTDDLLKTKIMQDGKLLFERKENNYPWYDSFIELGEALDRLEEMVHEPETTKTYVRDATIQRFEFCAELFWKTLKKICIFEKFEVTSPKNTLQKAFELKLVDDIHVWYEMLDDRNQTSHAYHREVAYKIYYKIDAYYKHMRLAYAHIKTRYEI